MPRERRHFDQAPRNTRCRCCGAMLWLAFDAHTGKALLLDTIASKDGTHVIQAGAHAYLVDAPRPPVIEMGPFRVHPRSHPLPQGFSREHPYPAGMSASATPGS